MRTSTIPLTTAVLAALFLAGCGKVQINEEKSSLIHSTRTNGKDTVVIEQRDGGEVTYTLNGKRVPREKVPADLLKPFDDDKGNFEELSF